ncbi:MAG: CHASE2 domain-containing protein [Ignavibacteriales bacterium]|nr:CHASE2 domain-containing protein [Ignavibacteriales bacterium]
MAQRTSKPIRIFLLQLGSSLVVAIMVLFITRLDPIQTLEENLITYRFKQKPIDTELKKRSNVVLVEINESTFETLPADYPFPVSYYARLVKNLNRAGAKVIAIDVLFSPKVHPDIVQENEFKEIVKQAGNVVLAGKIRTDTANYTIHVADPQYGNRFIEPLSSFGIVNVITDLEGTVREYLPGIYDQNQETILPSFSMATLNKYFQYPPMYIAPTSTSSGNIPAFVYYNKDIPKYRASTFLINYYGGSGAFPRVPFEQIIDDKDFKTQEELEFPGLEINTFDEPEGYLTNGTFTNKIVIVGAGPQLAEEKDIFPTPFEKISGAEIHANVIQSIIDNNFIIPQPFLLTIPIVIGLSLFTFVFIAGLKSIKIRYNLLIDLLGIALTLSLLYIIVTISIGLFIKENYLVQMTSALLAVFFSYVGSIIYYYVVERRQKVMIKGMFSQYVNPTVVDELIAHPEKLRLGGERKELTVFFSDIENFTKMSEQLRPEYLVTILNEYLSEMTKIILENNGTLDKYEGDAIVAFWGAPIPQSDHAFLACRAAVQMQRRLDELRNNWLKEGKPELKVRIGINTGEVVVGNMGGADRFDYTIIGDSVNLGARLESANKQYKTKVMISSSTYQYVSEKIISRELDLLVVMGKTEPIRVYELIGINGESLPAEKLMTVELYKKGLAHYRKKEWDEAVKEFEKVLKISPDDFPSQLYIERSYLYKKNPPPENWNGVFILQTK